MAGEAGTVGTPPAHYAGQGLQPFDVIDAYKLGFFDGNALKYLLRWDKKGSRLDDLRKALHYLQETIIRWDAYDVFWDRPRATKLPEQMDPDAVRLAFNLDGHVATAVFYLLHWRTCDDGACLRTAERYAARAVREEAGEASLRDIS